MEAGEPDRETGGAENMKESGKLEQALEVLRQFVCTLAAEAGQDAVYGESFWGRLCRSQGLLQELSYYHDYGTFLCKYEVAGYTLADVLVWQVDHFKLYMDRPEEMNRYRQPRLLLAAFDTMLQMEENPEQFVEKMRSETGQDILWERAWEISWGTKR